jgi:carbon monoxide dehydrogenase subunit G
MKLESSRKLPVSQQVAWAALNDLDVLKRCIPGCESLTKDDDGSLDAIVVMRIGPVGAKFGGKVTFEDVQPPSSYRLIFAGQGGAAGFAKGEAKVELLPESPTACELRYTSEAAVGGKLAQVGSRLIESSAKKLAEQFFSKFETSLSTAPAANAPAAAVAPESSQSVAPLPMSREAPTTSHEIRSPSPTSAPASAPSTPAPSPAPALATPAPSPAPALATPRLDTAPSATNHAAASVSEAVIASLHRTVVVAVATCTSITIVAVAILAGMTIYFR